MIYHLKIFMAHLGFLFFKIPLSLAISNLLLGLSLSEFCWIVWINFKLFFLISIFLRRIYFFFLRVRFIYFRVRFIYFKQFWPKYLSFRVNFIIIRLIFIHKFKLQGFLSFSLTSKKYCYNPLENY